jgi:tetratricopeptide (TPR) repeat protein
VARWARRLPQAGAGPGPAGRVHATSAFEVDDTPGGQLHDLLTIFLNATGGFGGIDHVVNDVGGSSTIANPDTPVDTMAGADRELDAVEADLALARGRIIHGRFLDQRSKDLEQKAEDPRELALFERALQLYQLAGDVRGEAESLFWLGCYQQVVRRDHDAALPFLERSCELAARVGDKRTTSDALRHLGIAEHASGRLDAARQRLEESVRLRREIGLMTGVAANLVGLTYIAAGQGRRDDALALAAEAGAIAAASGAHAILRQVDEARAQVSERNPPSPR